MQDTRFEHQVSKVRIYLKKSSLIYQCGLTPFHKWEKLLIYQNKQKIIDSVIFIKKITSTCYVKLSHQNEHLSGKKL